MNLISSIHDTEIDVTVETHQQSEIERSPEADINVKLFSAGFSDDFIGLNAKLLNLFD